MTVESLCEGIGHRPQRKQRRDSGSTNPDSDYSSSDSEEEEDKKTDVDKKESSENDGL